ncbi:AT hook, DNA-binding domain-containing protein [Archaeoglobus veneficus SNP6]|uniref:AT hook, DNA-binding domain-containing protein n=2 Tax=Archaeoglobus veneficus TaxID=58290 RepID=F2KSI1_ARCVS|nr:AT hook, DNA-binding domain-containing protein [Archaeoglobus veneficus SNP6]
MGYCSYENEFSMTKRRGRPRKYGEETTRLTISLPKSLKLKLEEVAADNMSDFVVQAIEDKLATVDDDYEQKLLKEIEETKKHLQHLQRLYEEIQHQKLMAVKEEITSRLDSLMNSYRIYDSENELDEKKLKYYKDMLELRIRVLANDLNKPVSEVLKYVKQLYPDVKILEELEL